MSSNSVIDYGKEGFAISLALVEESTNTGESEKLVVNSSFSFSEHVSRFVSLRPTTRYENSFDAINRVRSLNFYEDSWTSLFLSLSFQQNLSLGLQES